MRSTALLVVFALLAGVVAWCAGAVSIGPALQPAIEPARATATVSEVERETGLATPAATRAAQHEAQHADGELAATADVSHRIALGPKPRASRRPDIGRLAVLAIDADTSEPLQSFRVRAGNDARIADETSSTPEGALELPLTADEYSIVVSAPGYESVALPATRVVAGQIARAEPAQLRGGAGSIAVELRGELAPIREFEVQLVGNGRRPCERCSDAGQHGVPNDERALRKQAWSRNTACPSCGFAASRSSARLAGGSSFTFDHLASGKYALRVVDADGQGVFPARELALHAGERTTLALDLGSLRYVELEWLDTDGRSLTEEWRRRIGARELDVDPAGSERRLRSNPLELAFLLADTTAASATLHPPLPRGFVSRGMRYCCGCSRMSRRDRVDRPRRPEETLWPEPVPARLESAQVACKLLLDGRARVGPVPVSNLRLHVTAENFAADAEIPASASTEHVTLRLHSTLVESGPEQATYCGYELEPER